MKSLWVKIFGVLILALGATWSALRFREVPAPLEPHPFFVGVPRHLNIAHRGASGEKVEHTWEAYDLALKDGAEVLELDLRMTLDGVIVVAHDRSLARLTGQPLVISESTYEQLKAAVGDQAPIPLTTVLERYPGRINLEIKERRVEAAQKLSEILRAAKREHTVIVASFHPGVLEAFREDAGPAFATAAHFGEALKFYAFYRLGLPSSAAFQALQIPTRFKVLTLDDPEFIAYAHQHGIFVHYWTIDEEPEMRHLLDVGADGVMTNFPGRLERIIQEKAP